MLFSPAGIPVIVSSSAYARPPLNPAGARGQRGAGRPGHPADGLRRATRVDPDRLLDRRGRRRDARGCRVARDVVVHVEGTDGVADRRGRRRGRVAEGRRGERRRVELGGRRSGDRAVDVVAAQVALGVVRPVQGDRGRSGGGRDDGRGQAGRRDRGRGVDRADRAAAEHLDRRDGRVVDRRPQDQVEAPVGDGHAVDRQHSGGVGAAGGRPDVEAAPHRGALGLDVEDPLARAVVARRTLGEQQPHVDRADPAGGQRIAQHALGLRDVADVAAVGAEQRVVVRAGDVRRAGRALGGRGGRGEPAGVGRPDVAGRVGVGRATDVEPVERALCRCRSPGHVTGGDGEGVVAGHERRAARALVRHDDPGLGLQGEDPSRTGRRQGDGGGHEGPAATVDPVGPTHGAGRRVGDEREVQRADRGRQCHLGALRRAGAP